MRVHKFEAKWGKSVLPFPLTKCTMTLLHRMYASTETFNGVGSFPTTMNLPSWKAVGLYFGDMLELGVGSLNVSILCQFGRLLSHVLAI